MIESKPTIKPQPNKAEYGVSELALFEVYQTREAYKAKFGVDPPKFDETERPKYWFDTTPDTTDMEADVSYLVCRKVNNVPKLMRVSVPVWEAIRVNIPDSVQEGAAGIGPYIKTPRDLPIRELLPGEALFVDFGGIPGIMRADLKAAEDEKAESFTPKDRVMLKAIAAKLGVA